MEANVNIGNMQFGLYKCAIFKLIYGREDNYALYHYITDDKLAFVTEDIKSINYSYKSRNGKVLPFENFPHNQLLAWILVDKEAGNKIQYYTGLAYMLIVTQNGAKLIDLDFTGGKVCFSVDANKFKQFAESLNDSTIFTRGVDYFVNYVERQLTI